MCTKTNQKFAKDKPNAHKAKTNIPHTRNQKHINGTKYA
jgi:hypothetical protein